MIPDVVAPPGDQRYVPPVSETVSFSTALSPGHMLTLLTLEVTALVTVTRIVSVMELPVVGVYFTVYIVLAAGVTTMDEVVAPPGVQR